MSTLLKEYFNTVFIFITGLLSIGLFFYVFTNNSFAEKIGFNRTNNETVIQQNVQINDVVFSVPDTIVLENDKNALDYITASLKETNDLLPFVKTEETVFLNYIKSSGDEYIDTGIKATKNIKVIIEFEINELLDSTVLFATTDTNTKYGAYITKKENNYYIVPRITDTSEPKFILLTTGKHIYSQVTDGMTLSCYLDDNHLTDEQFFENTDYNITLFSNGESKKTAYKLYSCKIYNSEELIKDFIPAKTNSDVVLYDTVSKLLYKNSGAGSFEPGNNTLNKIMNFTLIFDNKNITKTALVKEGA